MQEVEYYRTKLGTTFGGKHSFRDFGLYPRERPDLGSPEIREVTVEVPGMDGVLDLGDALTGKINFGNRKITWEFVLLGLPRRQWNDRLSTIFNALHGNRMECVLDEDKEWYWQGRLSVKKAEAGDFAAYVTIEGDMDPWKRSMSHTAEKWKWDPFSFVSGVIRYYADLAVSGMNTFRIIGYERRIQPTITASADMTLTAGGRRWQLRKGGNYSPDLFVEPGEQEWTFEGTGTVSIEYRGLSL